MTLENLLHLGPLALLAFFALMITVDRFFVLYLSTDMSKAEDFFKLMKDHVLQDRIQDAVELAKSHSKKPYGFVSLKALERSNQPEENVKQAQPGI